MVRRQALALTRIVSGFSPQLAHCLLAEDFSEFTMDAVARKAGVIRPTVYYQFASKTGWFDERYNYARRGEMNRPADVFQKDNDPLRTLHDVSTIFEDVRFDSRFDTAQSGINS
jgi:AcrR family transcriptional regulator